jgi:hypothetical protein
MPADRLLTAEQAARMIYNTQAPSHEQIAKVEQKLRRGSLRPGPQGKATTTTAAVAEYLARRTAAQAEQNHPSARRPAAGAALEGYYKELLADYFLALLLQRTRQRRTRAFTIGVTAMQIALVLLPIVIFVSTYRASLQAMIRSPARVATETWMRGQYDEYEIEKIDLVPPDRLRVSFWYKQKGTKRVQTIRILTFDGNAITAATMED